jgi:hypothetical protein
MPSDALDRAIRAAVAAGYTALLDEHQPVHGHCRACAQAGGRWPAWPCQHYRLAVQAQRVGSDPASDIASATRTGSASKP